MDGSIAIGISHEIFSLRAERTPTAAKSAKPTYIMIAPVRLRLLNVSRMVI